ncbi:nitroreductase family protein [Endozoicomonas numazuensis]|uniref:Putative NAD(P)H nitroreductase n=1 Tax=Endozoicomonas numazuensis TaxID=1137799 RepID=A0A081NG32_9GAMM|nr:nitroreductase [Endozoicomonas numazuensis]KEQ17405.1 nitroreductase [Endozoicomonas numazuensis]
MDNQSMIMESLTQRVSRPVLTDPGPDAEQLRMIFKAALRAPDHGRLRPWRFLTITGGARLKLGELFARSAVAEQPDLSPDAVERLKGLPLRAPVLIALICNLQEHPKVPELEQYLSAGAAAQNILHAAFAQGVGAMWRTGAVSYYSGTAKGLGLSDNERLLGFIYLGTPTGPTKKVDELNPADFVAPWKG